MTLTADHFLEDLFAGIDGHLVDGLVPLGADKVQLAAVPECAPLRVDHHVLLAGEVSGVQRPDILDERKGNSKNVVIYLFIKFRYS